jgi:hypothetical protein
VKAFFVIPKRDMACLDDTNFPFTLNFFEAAFFRFEYFPNVGEYGVGRYFLDQNLNTLFLRSLRVRGPMSVGTI